MQSCTRSADEGLDALDVGVGNAAWDFLNSASAKSLTIAQSRELIDRATARLPTVPAAAKAAGDVQGVNAFPAWAFWTIVCTIAAGVIVSVVAGFVVQKNVRNDAAARLANEMKRVAPTPTAT